MPSHAACGKKKGWIGGKCGRGLKAGPPKRAMPWITLEGDPVLFEMLDQ